MTKGTDDRLGPASGGCCGGRAGVGKCELALPLGEGATGDPIWLVAAIFSR